MKKIAKKIILFVSLVMPSTAFAKPPMEYTVYRDIGAVNVYANCSAKGDPCNIVDPEKDRQKRDKMRNFIDQMRWLGRESELAAFEANADAVKNVKKWFLDYESAPGLVYVHPTEGKSDRDIEEDYQELHYVMFNIALSYYKVRPFFAPDEQKRVEKWLEQVINVNMYSATSRYGLRTYGRNNHYFIIASSLGMTGVVTNNKKYIADAKRLIEEAIDEMNGDGGWPLELRRGDKSAHYQMFMLNHMIAATLAVGLVDAEWANKRLAKFKKTELFTAKLISDESFFIEKTKAPKLDMSFDYSPGKRCTGQVWSWITLSRNREEIESLLQGKYRISYEGCNNDYLIGGSPQTAKSNIFK